MKRSVWTLGRIFLASIFIGSGLTKVADPSGTIGYMTAFGMPAPEVLLVGAIVCELGAGLALLFGFRPGWMAAALALYLVPTTLIFHHAVTEQAQLLQFLKNLSIIGGLLAVVARDVDFAAGDDSHEDGDPGQFREQLHDSILQGKPAQ
jgi:putative oxidoreductase